MPNFARQLRAASGQVGQGRPSSSSFRSLNEDDDLHLSSHEISDHQHDDYAAAECDHRPLPPDSNVDGAYDYQFAIAPQDQQHHHHQQQQQHTQTRQQARQPQKKNNHQRHKRNKYQDNPQHEQELTRIPLTHMNSTDHILDHTFGDSLQSLSESLSNLDADVANEEELALRIIEEAAAAQRYDSDSGHDGGRRRQRRRAMLGCCSIIVGIVVMSALVGRSRSRKANAATKDDPLGLLSQEPDDTRSETDVWERVCSAHSVSSADGRHQCADACRIYDCCAADDGGGDGDGDKETTCADQKRDDCERFWRLCPDVLEIPVDLSSSANPQRTSNWEQQQLIQACGEANTNTAKFDICNDLCADHLCCLDMYGGGCVKLKEYQCHLYREPCSVLAIDLAQAIAKHVGEDHNEKVEGGGRHNLR